MNKTPSLDCICAWDFREDPGEPRISNRKYKYALLERNGPIAHNTGLLFGSYIHITRGQYLIAPRASVPGLNLYGECALSVFAIIRFTSRRPWQFIAGMWDERKKRQYGLFIGAERRTLQLGDVFVQNLVTGTYVSGYISDVGGNTEGYTACVTRATGGTNLSPNRWYTIGFTYDRKSIRVYVNGMCDVYERSNPFPCDNYRIFDGGESGTDFTVGHRAYHEWPDFPTTPAPKNTGFEGDIAALHVYNRALSEKEIDDAYTIQPIY